MIMSEVNNNPAMPGDPILVSDDGKAWYPGILHELRPNGDFKAICRVLDRAGNIRSTENWRHWKPWPGVTPGY